MLLNFKFFCSSQLFFQARKRKSCLFKFHHERIGNIICHIDLSSEIFSLAVCTFLQFIAEWGDYLHICERKDSNELMMLTDWEGLFVRTRLCVCYVMLVHALNYWSLSPICPSCSLFIIFSAYHSRIIRQKWSPSLKMVSIYFFFFFILQRMRVSCTRFCQDSGCTFVAHSFAVNLNCLHCKTEENRESGMFGFCVCMFGQMMLASDVMCLPECLPANSIEQVLFLFLGLVNLSPQSLCYFSSSFPDHFFLFKVSKEKQQKSCWFAEREIKKRTQKIALVTCMQVQKSLLFKKVRPSLRARKIILKPQKMYFSSAFLWKTSIMNDIIFFMMREI